MFCQYNSVHETNTKLIDADTLFFASVGVFNLCCCLASTYFEQVLYTYETYRFKKKNNNNSNIISYIYPLKLNDQIQSNNILGMASEVHFSAVRFNVFIGSYTRFDNTSLT